MLSPNLSSLEKSLRYPSWPAHSLPPLQNLLLLLQAESGNPFHISWLFCNALMRTDSILDLLCLHGYLLKKPNTSTVRQRILISVIPEAKITVSAHWVLREHAWNWQKAACYLYQPCSQNDQLDHCYLSPPPTACVATDKRRIINPLCSVANLNYLK